MNKPDDHTDDADRLIAAVRRNREQREKEYRERALKMYPHICARCGREFTGKKLRQLTVHHKDHNHENNPSDGSNWELLCLYCHDMEHQEYLDEQLPAEGGEKTGRHAIHRPFAGLADLLKRGKRGD
jgi:5-methylcytosine-specific restriction endonuclease McrA